MKELDKGREWRRLQLIVVLAVGVNARLDPWQLPPVCRNIVHYLACHCISKLTNCLAVGSVQLEKKRPTRMVEWARCFSENQQMEHRQQPEQDVDSSSYMA